MKNKKFFKRLSAVVIGFWLGISSAASIGAISPVDLWEKIDAYKSETSILNDYETFIKPNLSENGFGQSHLQTARRIFCLRKLRVMMKKGSLCLKIMHTTGFCSLKVRYLLLSKTSIVKC